MTDRSTSDPQHGHDDDTAPEQRDPLHLSEGTDAHAELPGGPAPDVPLLPGSSDGSGEQS